MPRTKDSPKRTARGFSAPLPSETVHREIRLGCALLDETCTDLVMKDLLPGMRARLGARGFQLPASALISEASTVPKPDEFAVAMSAVESAEVAGGLRTALPGRPTDIATPEYRAANDLLAAMEAEVFRSAVAPIVDGADIDGTPDATPSMTVTAGEQAAEVSVIASPDCRPPADRFVGLDPSREHADLDEAAGRLVDAVRLRSGDLQDDVAVALVRLR